MEPTFQCHFDVVDVVVVVVQQSLQIGIMCPNQMIVCQRPLESTKRISLDFICHQFSLLTPLFTNFTEPFIAFHTSCINSNETAIPDLTPEW